MKQTVEEAARIEREKVILELHDAYRIHKDPKHYVTSNVLIQKYAVPLFKAGAEWQLKQSPWISVEERLPENNTVVLTRGAYGFLKLWKALRPQTCASTKINRSHNN